MANDASLQKYEVTVEMLIRNLILIFSALLTWLELLRETGLQQGVFVARYAIAAGVITLIVRKLSLPLMMIRGVNLLTVSTVMAALSAITDLFFLFVHHIFFNGIVLNITPARLYCIQPTSLFGTSENPGDVTFGHSSATKFWSKLRSVYAVAVAPRIRQHGSAATNSACC